MVEPGTQNRGGMAGVLGSAKNHDSLRRVKFLQRGSAHDLNNGCAEKKRDKPSNEDKRTKPPAPRRRLARDFVVHPCVFTLLIRLQTPADRGVLLIRHWSLREETGNLIRRNCAFADNPPAGGSVRQIDNRGSDIARRSTTVNNDADAAVQLVAHLLGARAFCRTAKIGD